MITRTFKHLINLHPKPQLPTQLYSTSYTTLSHFSTSRGTPNKKSSSKAKSDSTANRIAEQLRIQQQAISKAASPEQHKTEKKPHFEKKVYQKPSFQDGKPISRLSDIMNVHNTAVPEPTHEPKPSRPQEDIDIKPTGRTEKEEDEAVNFQLDVPWDFTKSVKKQSEGNLKSSMAPDKLLNHKVAVALFKDYVQALEEYDIDRLGELLEQTFWERCSRNLLKMKKKGYKFVAENITSKKSKMDLFEITNMFTVGVLTNRKLNDGEEHYYVFHNKVDGSPTKNIVKRKIVGDEKAVVKVMLDITVEAPIRIKLYDNKGELVGEPSDKQGIDYHHMRIENDMMEVDYKTYRRTIDEGGEPDEETLQSFKNVFSQDNWKIVDFDGYMNGNPIVRPRILLSE